MTIAQRAIFVLWNPVSGLFSQCCITGTPVTLEKSNNERNPDKSISKVTLPEVDSSDNEQEFITPVVACFGDENDTANAQAVSNDDHAASLTTPFLEV